MSSIAKLEKVLDTSSSKEEVLEALSELQIKDLSPEFLKEALEHIRESSGIHPDLAQELEELGRFAIDCSGTGGSGKLRFNTSSAVAFVLAAAGFKVAKFGARASSGKSGSFDFLEELGLNKELPLSQISDALSVCGAAFIYAPLAYPRLKALAPLRKEFAKPTLFNYIGPLLNPVRPAKRLMGISCHQARKLVARELSTDESSKKALLVTAGNGLDELTFDGVSEISLVENSKIEEFQFDPANIAGFSEKAGIKANGLSHDARENAEIFLRIINGEDSNSASYLLLLLNSAAALYVLKACRSIPEGVILAQELIAGGEVTEALATCRRFYDKLS